MMTEEEKEDLQIIEFVESNPDIFQKYLFWKQIQDKIEHIEYTEILEKDIN